MELRDLRYFSTIVDEGSINKAAARIGVSQPALTKSVRMLELYLGVKLLHRSAKGVSTTGHGKLLYARSKSIVAELVRAESEIAALTGGGTGTLTVGVLPSESMNVLPAACVRLMNELPDLRLRIVEKPLADLEAGLRQGEFDFIMSLLARDNTDRALVQKILFYDHPSVLVRQGHPLLKEEGITIARLAAFPWILPPTGTARRSQIDLLFSSSGFSLPDKIIECHSVSFIKKIVLESDYIGFLQNHVRTPEEHRGLLCAVKVEPRVPARAIGVLYRSDYPLSDPAKILIRHIQSASVRSGHH